MTELQKSTLFVRIPVMAMLLVLVVVFAAMQNGTHSEKFVFGALLTAPHFVAMWVSKNWRVQFGLGAFFTVLAFLAGTVENTPAAATAVATATATTAAGTPPFNPKAIENAFLVAFGWFSEMAIEFFTSLALQDYGDHVSKFAVEEFKANEPAPEPTPQLLNTGDLEAAVRVGAMLITGGKDSKLGLKDFDYLAWRKWLGDNLPNPQFLVQLEGVKINAAQVSVPNTTSAPAVAPAASSASATPVAPATLSSSLSEKDLGRVINRFLSTFGMNWHWGEFHPNPLAYMTEKAPFINRMRLQRPRVSGEPQGFTLAVPERNDLKAITAFTNLFDLGWHLAEFLKNPAQYETTYAKFLEDYKKQRQEAWDALKPAVPSTPTAPAAVPSTGDTTAQAPVVTPPAAPTTPTQPPTQSAVPSAPPPPPSAPALPAAPPAPSQTPETPPAAPKKTAVKRFPVGAKNGTGRVPVGQ